jgi:MFS family permease
VAERRASEPLIPFSLFRVPALRAASVIGIPLGMVMFAIISFLPLFVQVVLRSSATDAGRVLTPMMLAVVVGSAIGSPVVLRIGYRLMCLASFTFLVVGTFLLSRVGVESSQIDVSIAMVCIGTGMGFGFIATMLAAQNSVDLPRMGVATGLVNFTRQLGGVFGVAIAAALMLTTLTNRLKELFPGTQIKAGSLLSPQAAARFPPETQHLVRGAFADALHVVFVAALVIAIIGVFTVALMPRGKPADIRDAARAEVIEPVLPDGEMLYVLPTKPTVDAEGGVPPP